MVIGSGFAGLSAACFMAKAGWEVAVLEKNSTPGGRARVLQEKGFTFDMGPSWYWMPDVFERFFLQFNRHVADYYSLTRLDPSYRVYWNDGFDDIPADLPAFGAFLEKLEPGSSARLDQFLKEAAFKYNIGIKKLVFKPGLSIREFADWQLLKGVVRLDVFTSIKKHIRRHFSHPRICQLLEFPVLFLGALPENTPALYSLMNYADIAGGTWYPGGGFYSVVKAMHQLAEELGASFYFDQPVERIEISGKKASKVFTTDLVFEPDAIIGGADYHHIETALLPKKFQSYSERYWNSREMAPSCLIYFVGLNKKLLNVQHHLLFFDVPFKQHAQQIYKAHEWPDDPLFYVSIASVTDPSVAPEGGESLFFLIPVAAGLLNDDAPMREKYFNKIIRRFEERTAQNIRDSIVYKRSYAHADFVKDYHSFKGNAYGLANTLLQTANMKPSCRSNKVSNLFYTGQLTVPGPGVPPCIISGEVVANEVLKHF